MQEVCICLMREQLRDMRCYLDESMCHKLGWQGAFCSRGCLRDWYL